MNLTFVFFCFRVSTILVAFYPKACSEREKKSVCVCVGVEEEEDMHFLKGVEIIRAEFQEFSLSA